MAYEYDVCVVGGCGRVGLPLALSFADAGRSVLIEDINEAAVAMVSEGRMPFRETGAQALLEKVIHKKLWATMEPEAVARAEHVVVIIGTPVDEHLNPSFYSLLRFLEEMKPRLRSGQLLILRSTIFPGTTEKVAAMFEGTGVGVAFCPERVAEGRALEEIRGLPQLVAGTDEDSQRRAESLFRRICDKTMALTPREAELTKVFANAWRYIQFATANQFFMIAASHGIDFYTLHRALTEDYPRMAGLPRAGFTAGPCLFKDTMQLSAADKHRFSLGHAAMLINEGFPGFVVEQLKKRYPLGRMRVGVLGMTFKGDSDDTRESLAFKLRKILAYECSEVLATDEFVSGEGILPLDEVLERAEIYIIAAPHSAYKTMRFPEGRPVIDVWNFYGEGVGFN